MKKACLVLCFVGTLILTGCEFDINKADEMLHNAKDYVESQQQQGKETIVNHHIGSNSTDDESSDEEKQEDSTENEYLDELLKGVSLPDGASTEELKDFVKKGIDTAGEKIPEDFEQAKQFIGDFVDKYKKAKEGEDITVNDKDSLSNDELNDAFNGVKEEIDLNSDSLFKEGE